MINGLRRRGVRMLLAATAMLAGAAGVALATAGSDGVINGCYEKRTGILRVLAAGKSCTQYETPITWNQKGPKGDQGPQGLQGERGPEGARGPAGPRGEVSLAAIAGTACSAANGSIGTVAVSVKTDQTIVLKCAVASGGDDTPPDDGGGTPETEICNGIDDDLDGMVDEDGTPALPNATSACVDGVVVIVSCDPGFLDADGDRVNGCELQQAAVLTITSPVGVGETALGTVALSAPVEADTTITLASSDPAIAAPELSAVDVSAGSATAQFTVLTLAPGVVTITAEHGAQILSTELVVTG